MRVEAGDAAAEHLRVEYWPLGEGEPQFLGTAWAFDSDEKWVEVYLLATGGPSLGVSKVFVADGKHQKARLRINFDVRDRRTGELVCSVRQ